MLQLKVQIVDFSESFLLFPKFLSITSNISAWIGNVKMASYLAYKPLNLKDIRFPFHPQNSKTEVLFVMHTYLDKFL